MEELRGRQVRLFESDLRRRENENVEYLLKLSNEHLLRNYKLEAGMLSIRGFDNSTMGGWESSTCQLRGHFLGHWLSAAALNYEAYEDESLKAKANDIIERLDKIQEYNGGRWVCSIPEKYLDLLAQAKPVWAPQYTIHKLFMGLIDVYRYMNISKALKIADRLADWFVEWSEKFSREQFDNILDVETGGMLEIWALLLEITQDQKYKGLIEKYYRARFFEPLLQGKDVLTNMHANTTIPEILGCAKLYEVTKEKKYLDIVKKYWLCAVTDRGYFATGGQTQGEIWTPKQKLKARLGDKNQEHCTVYNMIRLANFLFVHTKDARFQHYIEYNLQNGIKAQTYWRGESKNNNPDSGLVTYFLPLKAGSKKDWAGEMDSFFCCHGTMVQANAALNRLMYYLDQTEKTNIYITQYAASFVEFYMDDQKIKIRQTQDFMNGSLQSSSLNAEKQTISDITSAYANKPDFIKYKIRVEITKKVNFALNIRIPDWITGEAQIYLNQNLYHKTSYTDKFVTIEKEWKNNDLIELVLPIGLKFIPLPDDNSMGAFRYGSEVLAGLTEQERILFIEEDDPCKELSVDTERQWGDFRTFYKTENQDPGINFIKLNEVGYDSYQVYFKVKKR